MQPFEPAPQDDRYASPSLPFPRRPQGPPSPPSHPSQEVAAPSFSFLQPVCLLSDHRYRACFLSRSLHPLLRLLFPGSLSLRPPFALHLF